MSLVEKGLRHMFEEIGGTAIIALIALYFTIKWAVKNGIKEAYATITGQDTEEQKQVKEAIDLFTKKNKKN